MCSERQKVMSTNDSSKVLSGMVGKSFMYRLKRAGPSIEPFGT